MSYRELTSRRRGHDGSGDSEASRTTSLMEKMMESIQLEERLNPKLTLKRFLSVRSVISTNSSFAERQQAAVGTRSEFRSIGAGTCGRVFQVPGTVDIFKVAIYPGQITDQLWNDYITHIKVSKIFEEIGRDKLQVRVPMHKYFVGQDDSTWWNENLARFPKQLVDAPSNVLCAERILPLAKPIREALIDLYCPADARAIFKADRPNKDCLIRLYMGARRRPLKSKFTGFQLRNFPLFLDQMEDLELDIADFASSIGEALAMMHWACHLDANDVEFVLGSAPEYTAEPALILTKPLSIQQVSSMKPNTSTWNAHLADFKRRTTHIWMLDFNRCAEFQPGQSGLQQLVHAFFRNDPYFPKPLAALVRDQQLWTCFRKSYEHTSDLCFQSDKSEARHSQLPKRFVEMVVEEQRSRLEKQKAMMPEDQELERGG
ncbi:hypothetical protein T440DRAFT_536958 [Plenodomus tracheiphilus IPT5]|uniref:DUF3669 domain-containing protein n=1 Tax=Plenodomus tracheiphilus IPT5 TaxID=1408161 RepID=A0A6A7AY98_9PLEO|nr:hypothetical protein T440DRAFT_536958 [Plenodomus tracheiphilus IPT5]